jgi:hypothetical protein
MKENENDEKREGARSYSSSSAITDSFNLNTIDNASNTSSGNT